MKTVAILSQSAPMAAAIQMLLTPRLPNAEFVTVSKVTELPEGDITVASLGIPNFLPTDRVSEVLNVNTAYESDPAIRSKNWDYMRSEDADPADLIQLLGGADSYKVIPSRKAMAVRTDFAEARADFAEAETAEEKLEAMTKMRDLAISVSALG